MPSAPPRPRRAASPAAPMALGLRRRGESNPHEIAQHGTPLRDSLQSYARTGTAIAVSATDTTPHAYTPCSTRRACTFWWRVRGRVPRPCAVRAASLHANAEGMRVIRTRDKHVRTIPVRKGAHLCRHRRGVRV
jgi:hypothetical protein